MTKKQTEEMNRLARLFADKDQYPYEWVESLYKDVFYSFINGYIAAQEPKQLILNEHVKALVDALELEKKALTMRGMFDAPDNINNALKPFQKKEQAE